MLGGKVAVDEGRLRMVRLNLEAERRAVRIGAPRDPLAWFGQLLCQKAGRPGVEDIIERGLTPTTITFLIVCVMFAEC